MWSRLRWPGLIVLVVVDVVLVVMALRPPEPADVSPTRAAASPSSTSTSSEPTRSSSSTSSTGSTARTKLPAAERLTTLLEGVDADTAWRADVGSCQGGDTALEVTEDGGASWETHEAPLSFIGRIRATEPTVGFAVGAAQDCVPVVVGTGDAGATWAAPGPADSTWALDPASDTGLIRPSGEVVTPCGGATLADLAVVTDTDALVLCAGGRVLTTEDSGESWNTLAKVDGAFALSDGGDTGAVAVTAGRSRDCEGLAVTTVGQGGGTEAASCVDVTGKVTPGSVAVSVAGSEGWLLVGEDVWRSGRGLDDWQVASAR